MLSNIISFVAEIAVMPFSIAIIAAMVVMAILLFALALLSCSEHAFFSVSSPQIKLLRSQKSRLSKTIVTLLDSPQNLYATLLVLHCFVNICVIIIASYCISATFGSGLYYQLSFAVHAFIITIILVLFGAVLPKIFASYYGLRIVFFMAYPVKILHIILMPLNRLFINISVLTDKRIKQGNKVSLEDLTDALDFNSDDTTSDKEILTSIIRLQKTYVTEIMKSRVDIISADISLDFGHITQLIRTNNYSRIPVYAGTIDNIKGVLYVKDLIPHLDNPANFSWQPLIRPPYYVPETKKIDSLLEEFQKRHIHIALVVDEYGGTAGIVSLEDIIEEIAGEIHDDDADDLPEYLQINDSTYLFEGKCTLKSFCKLFKLENDFFESVQGDADTIAGLILEIKGDFPSLHEEIRYKNFIFKIESEDERRIKRIKVINTQT